MRIQNLTVVAALVAGLLCGSASAAIVANPFHNYETPDDATTGTWEDSGTASGGNVLDWNMADSVGVDVVSVTDPAVTFTSAYSFPGGAGEVGGTTSSFGSTTSNDPATFEIWFRVNGPSDVDTTQPTILFETGGNKGLTFFLENDGSVVTLTGVTGKNSTAVMSYTLDSSDFGAFLQATLVTGVQEKLFVNNSATPGDPTFVDSGSTSEDWLGSNDAGLGRVNNNANRPDDQNDDWDQSDAVSFKGEIAILRHYDNVEFTKAQVNQNFGTIIPEPATLALISLGGAVMLARRRRQ